MYKTAACVCVCVSCIYMWGLWMETGYPSEVRTVALEAVEGEREGVS